jgi:hypothetical protein
MGRSLQAVSGDPVKWEIYGTGQDRPSTRSLKWEWRGTRRLWP